MVSNQKNLILFLSCFVLQACEQQQFFAEFASVKDNKPSDPPSNTVPAPVVIQSRGDLTLTVAFEACSKPRPITVELRSSTRSPASSYQLIESVSGIGGGGIPSVIHFERAQNGVPYYIVVRSYNSLATWSAVPVLFQLHQAKYDFTSSVNQAYGSNQSLYHGAVSIYQGDVNHDDLIDEFDLSLVYAQSVNFTTTLETDLTCDNFTDLSDLIYVDNNRKFNNKVLRPE